ncbi:Uncharacterized [Moorella glycerini]|uniref:Uncharacterized protein n=1 Tax=Neomoorella stamsii TaxID=1266720 RepID=A0A9X7P4S4_9FIRM|nr:MULTISPECIES: hypothetical protein [Moorella]PRR69218.1 hypothetical protein MOST_30980 [Moorella stamsii]CEP67954.1 Uncharacterized [Moorella glycerini]
MAKSKNTTTPGLTGLVDVLSPQALDFGARQITIGEQVARVLVITDYPPRVGPAWLARVAGMTGVVASIHVRYPYRPGEPGIKHQPGHRRVHRKVRAGR